MATHLLHGPERGLGLLVHFPNVRILNGEDDETPRVFSE